VSSSRENLETIPEVALAFPNINYISEIFRPSGARTLDSAKPGTGP
jgi:hypothetical protein